MYDVVTKLFMVQTLCPFMANLVHECPKLSSQLTLFPTPVSTFETVSTFFDAHKPTRSVKPDLIQFDEAE